MSTKPESARRSSVARGLAGLLLALSLVCGSIAPASARPATPASPAAFGIGPANTHGIDGRPFLNYVSSPKGETADHIAVVNLGAKPLTVSLYTADGVSGADGRIGYEPKADPGPDAGTWITLPRNTTTLTLRPRSSHVLPISVHVPANATPGDHIAGIVVSVTSRVRSRSGEDVDFEQRVALRTLIRVSGPLQPGLRIEHLVADYHGTLNPFGSGSVSISFRVRNSGNINLGGKQAVTVTGLFGAAGALSAVAAVPVLIPGGDYPVRLTVHDVWPEIFMHARVSVHPAGLATAADPALDPVSRQTSFRAVPWSLLGLLALLALAVAGALRQRRHRRAHPVPSAPDAGRPPAPALATKD
ncbi:MAG TPA: hypothetical protein VGN18_12675 [Jatrophihabitans sp.]|jgi:hypothetical protein|uniref:COG1470 family protein n=1 Tax=Jatrophihabitans sp. TaxID=1932789 RepID=UPI002E052211|nr:hypothetical protein [Jatrophihabitans sp.]